MFGKIPDGYQKQLSSVLENYDLISQSPKRKADYIRGLLLMGKLNLNDRHKEVLDIFLKNDFDKDEVSFDQGINPITMARFFQLINNLYYDKEDQIVSHSDVSEALSDALDWLVSEKERTGENSLKQLNWLEDINTARFRENSEKLYELIGANYETMSEYQIINLITNQHKQQLRDKKR